MMPLPASSRRIAAVWLSVCNVTYLALIVDPVDARNQRKAQARWTAMASSTMRRQSRVPKYVLS